MPADGPEASTHDVQTAVDLATVSSSSQRLQTEFYNDSTELQSLDELIGPCADRMPLAAESIDALNQAHTMFQTSSTTGEFVGQVRDTLCNVLSNSDPSGIAGLA